MMLYKKKPKDATGKPLELINGFGNFARYKINMQKSLAFLYANNKRSERQIQETILFTIQQKEYPEINLRRQNTGIQKTIK